MGNIIDIVKAWATSLHPSSSQIELAKERASICDGCEFKVEMDNSLLSRLIPDDQILNQFKCGKCGCPLAKKIFTSYNGCPLKKWKE